MSEIERPAPSRIVPVDRSRLRRRPASQVEVRELEAGRPLPLLVQSNGDGDALAWAEQNAGLVEERLPAHGAVLLRGFRVGGLDEFQRLVGLLGGELLEYTYRSTPRTAVRGNVYTSTEYPADQEIPMHNENSYTGSWPRRVFFYCEVAAAEGGMTPLADSALVYDRLPEEVRERFAAKGVLYVRNYGGGADLPWQDVFQTADREAVEEFCRNAGIEWEWRSGDRLRTRQVCQGVARHPETGRMLWFNQAHLFHVSSLPPELRQAMREVFADEDLPRQTFYGDGSPLEDEVLDLVRDVYREVRVSFPWREGDVLVVDNMAVAHGRTPYRGDRKVRVAMTQPFRADQLA